MRVLAYLDNNATTRLADEALAAMLPYLTDEFLNPSSAAGEIFGMRDVFAEAKAALARLFGSRDLAPGFNFTSGASESNSWAVHCALGRTSGGHAVATAIEHPSLLAALEARGRAGTEVALVPSGADGRIDPDRFGAAVRPDTAFVSIMAANNETGVIQPVAAVAERVRKAAPRAVVHVDATQAVGRVPLDLRTEWAEVDLVSLSAHKFHGPKGVGALFARPDVVLAPLIHGSGEDAVRGGTPNPAGAAGMGSAADLALRNLPSMAEVAMLRDRLETLLAEAVPATIVNGRSAPRLPNTSSVTIPGKDGPALVEALASRGICVATGAACTSGSPKPSRTLLAMGLDHDGARSTIRVSLSRATTLTEVELAAGEIARLVSSVA